MQPGTPNPLLQLLFPVFFLVMIYFFFIMPQKKKQQSHKKMIDEIKKNDEVVTIGGIHGTIVNVKEKSFVLRVDENSRIEFDKSSIAYVKKQRND